MVFVGEKMAESAKASVVPIINKTEFCNYKIPLPPLSLQREFVAIAEKAEAVKANLKNSIADIDQVMKGLINV
jgi:restriction endonuclease S subunit